MWSGALDSGSGGRVVRMWVPIPDWGKQGTRVLEGDTYALFASLYLGV